MRVNKWFTSDLHFGHTNIIKFCNRPFKYAWEMDEALIKNWNSVVKDRDQVYVLGDFSFHGNQKTKEIVSRLNGVKHLIWGNHDKQRPFLQLGFSSVYQEAILRLAKDIEVRLSHFPYLGADDNHPKGKHVDRKPLRDSKDHWLLCGHVHQHWKIKAEEKMINVGVDVWDGPVNSDTIIDIIRKNRAARVND